MSGTGNFVDYIFVSPDWIVNFQAPGWDTPHRTCTFELKFEKYVGTQNYI
jgi:hypothetical protein